MSNEKTCCEHHQINCNQGRTCPVRLGTHKPAEAVHQIQEPENAAEVWPCLNIDVDDAGNITNAKLYSPGLPAGNHDVYPVRVPYMDEHTEAWKACHAELCKLAPDFMRNSELNGIDSAVAAIRHLASFAKAEQAAWIAGFDEGRSQFSAVAVPDEREAFEAQFRTIFDFERSCFWKEQYGVPVTQAAWEGWQACAALAATPAAPVEHLDIDLVLSIADVHAEESREDGVRLMDRGGLVAFASDVLRAATPAAEIEQELVPPSDERGFLTGKTVATDEAAELRCLHARVQELEAQKAAQDGWRIDKSAGRDILVYNDCSVIEDEQAHYLMRLLSGAKE